MIGKPGDAASRGTETHLLVSELINSDAPSASLRMLFGVLLLRHDGAAVLCRHLRASSSRSHSSERTHPPTADRRTRGFASHSLTGIIHILTHVGRGEGSVHRDRAI